MLSFFKSSRQILKNGWTEYVDTTINKSWYIWGRFFYIMTHGMSFFVFDDATIIQRLLSGCFCCHHCDDREICIFGIGNPRILKLFFRITTFTGNLITFLFFIPHFYIDYLLWWNSCISFSGKSAQTSPFKTKNASGFPERIWSRKWCNPPAVPKEVYSCRYLKQFYIKVPNFCTRYSTELSKFT